MHTSNFQKAFDRYARFTDLKKLNEQSAKPLRKSMRVNTLKCSIDELRAWGKAKGWMLEPVPWCPEGLFIDRVDREEALGKDLLHVLGCTYMQEAASMLPVVLLDPQPGERVLDMSSAPGSKATQIVAAMRNTGLLIANDVQEKRLWSLISNLQRCGAMNTIVTKKVGQWFAGNMTEIFDRVLCDAPCTAQGTVRKDSDALRYCSMENIGKMARLQRELLESAVHACKVGGRIVYSTCTLTPEENEDVVLSVLNKFSTQLEVVDPRESGRWKVEGGKCEEAIEDSIRIQQSLQLNFPLSSFHFPLLRLWPQTFDTEGFFVAVLQKNAPTKSLKDDLPDMHRFELLPHARTKEITARLEDWYGTSFLREGELLLETKEQLLVVPESVLHGKLRTKPYLTGLPFGKPTNHGLLRIAHEMATLRGHEATRQVLTLSGDMVPAALSGKDIPVSDSVNLKDGDVLLSVIDPAMIRPLIVGRGMLKMGKVLSRLPREIVRMFA